ncbi:transcriptional regulatory protein [Fusarium albosuccineum]|uniref:Transcriptional regulatory protein n=1 Tax=Fusarium albosuccineum TaxID=1237068 RepID=A0A8H4LIM2_9HYPO|nr:transcriptional regulatory protein [Fusarium albosuccineum]
MASIQSVAAVVRTAVKAKATGLRGLQRQIEELRGRINSNATDVSSLDIPANTNPAASHPPDARDTLMNERPLPPASPPPTAASTRSALSACQPAHSVANDTRMSSPDASAELGEVQMYGATSLLHDHATGDLWTQHTSPDEEQEEDVDPLTRSATQDHLISQAAISKQREIMLYSVPSLTSNVDLDGPSLNMAMHLLDLHWNRLHFVYLLTYRPAIMDSLLNSGPYVNKLLLNAIYLQSSLYTTGMAFYNRFKALLPRYIDAPTMPTVVALLICGACLVPFGKQSAGWIYCGMAYRMIIDLGYHLNIPVSEKCAQPRLSALDIEIRRRVYWGAYASDKFQSLYLGRSPALRAGLTSTSREYLDTFEEWAEWKPPPSTTQNPQKIIKSLYSLESARIPILELLQTRIKLMGQLRQWRANLPTHLCFDLDQDITPPPHQVSLHTAYWTLIILVEQAFLRRGHFESAPDMASHEEARRQCVDAAHHIWKLLEACNNAFSLRHAHYGLYYAAYSAVLVMLQQPPQNRSDHIDCIRFFWAILSEYQKGYARGLKKPFRVLKSLMCQLQEVSQQACGPGGSQNTAGADQGNGLEAGTGLTQSHEWPGPSNADGWPDFWTDMAFDDVFLQDHAMFGLFTEQ